MHLVLKTVQRKFKRKIFITYSPFHNANTSTARHTVFMSEIAVTSQPTNAPFQFYCAHILYRFYPYYFYFIFFFPLYIGLFTWLCVAHAPEEML